jgi:hypothetical protein
MPETSTRPADLASARENLLRCALNVIVAERHLADPSVRFSLPEAEDALDFAARDLKEAVDALPLNRKPKGWVS